MATRYYRANAIRLNEEALQRLPQDGNLTDIRSLQLGESSTYQCEPSEDLYGAHQGCQCENQPSNFKQLIPCA